MDHVQHARSYTLKKADSPFPSSYRLPVACQLSGDFMPTSTEHAGIFFLSWSHSGLVHTVIIVMSSHVQLHWFFFFACLFLRLDSPLSTWLASKFRHTENCLSLVLGLKLWATIPGFILIFKIVSCRYFICSAGRARASEIFLILYMLYGICIFLTCVSTILDIGNYLC